jgi:hypothetical protein
MNPAVVNLMCFAAVLSGLAVGLLGLLALRRPPRTPPA